MNSLTTRTLTTLLFAAPLLAQGEHSTHKTTAALGDVAETKQDPAGATPASLVEQALYAEEHQRDFTRAAELFQRALDAARQANDAKELDRAKKGLDRVAARQRGAPNDAPQDDPILCSIARCLRNLSAPLDRRGGEMFPAELDIALYGAAAVPWLEKAVAQQFDLCGQRMNCNAERCVRVLSRMRLPEADAALARLAKSTDPLTRRAVVGFCDPDAQRSLLLAGLEDATPSVRETALITLAESKDRALAKVIEPEARRGQWVALRWLASSDPLKVLAIAVDAKLEESVRTAALDALYEGVTLKPSAESVDALLGLARSTATPTLAEKAMQSLADLAGGPWRPLADDLQQRIESALTAAPDAYPQPATSFVLLAIGGGPAIAASSKRLFAAVEKLPEQSNEQCAITQRVERRLDELGPDAFPYVVKAYAELPAPENSGTCRNQMLRAYARTVERLSVNASWSDLARSADALVGERFEFYARRAGARLAPGGHAAFLPHGSLGDEWLPLLRRMAASNEPSTRLAAILGFGKTLQPDVIPDLLTACGDSDGSVASAARDAIGQILFADPKTARSVFERALTDQYQKTGTYSITLLRLVSRFDASEALELAERYWSESQDRWIRDALYRVVCDVDGPGALDFLLRKMPELDASSGYARKLAVERFGTELYEPALDALEQMLRDSDGGVRAAAREAFAAFKAQREALAEFAAWKATASEARSTIDELLKLTESPNVDVVVGAVKALGALKASAAYPKLVRLLERKEPEIKTAVQAALDKLGE